MAKKLNPLFYSFVPVLAGVAFAIAILLAKRSGTLGMSDLKPFNLASYQQDWQTLQGNQYLLNCQIDQQLDYNEGKGRILAVKLSDGSGRVAVFVPVSLQQNFEVGQRYRMRVFVRKDVLYVEAVEKF